MVALYYLFQLLPFLPVLIALAWLAWRVRSRRAWTFMFTGASIVALTISLVLLVHAVLEARFDYAWAAPRLAPILSWIKCGDRLYYLRGEGPVLVRLYGPISSLIYAPAALASTP